MKMKRRVPDEGETIDLYLHGDAQVIDIYGRLFEAVWLDSDRDRYGVASGRAWRWRQKWVEQDKAGQGRPLGRYIARRAGKRHVVFVSPEGEGIRVPAADPAVELIDKCDREYGVGTNPRGGAWARVRTRAGREITINTRLVMHADGIPYDGGLNPLWEALVEPVL